MEEIVLLDDNGDVDDAPVAHEGEPVFEDIEEIVAAAEGAGTVDEHGDGGPDVPRDALGVSSKHLEAEGRGVGAWWSRRSTKELGTTNPGHAHLGCCLK